MAIPGLRVHVILSFFNKQPVKRHQHIMVHCGDFNYLVRRLDG